MCLFNISFKGLVIEEIAQVFRMIAQSGADAIARASIRLNDSCVNFQVRLFTSTTTLAEIKLC